MNLASRGLRDLDDGPQGIAEGVEKAALKVQARKVYLESAGWATVLTFVAWMLPRLG